MLAALVDVQASESVPAEGVLGQHPPDGQLHGQLGTGLHQGAVLDFLQAAHPAGVGAVVLLIQLLAGEHGLLGVDDDDVVAAVGVGSELGLPLAPQQLSGQRGGLAQGLSGGAAESTLAGLYNEYGNSRNTIDSGRNDNLASLRNSYDSSKASALQSYNGQLSDAEAAKLAYEMQLEQNLANAIADAASVNYDQQFALSQNYLSQLSDIQKAQAAAAQKAAAQSYSAGNSTRSVSTRQADVAGSGSNAYRLAQQVYSSYQNPDDVVDALMLSGVSNQDILDILNQMGIN